MVSNALCGIDEFGDSTYTAEGITKLCEGLKGSAVTSLECAATSCSLLCQRPLTRPYSLTVSILPLACSLRGNGIRDKGVTALAAILKETKITDLKCAATPECSLLCQRPLTLPSPQLGSLDSNQLCGVNFSGKGTYTTESITKLCEGLKGSSVTSLRCTVGPSVCLSVNAH